ncbi:MAG TPA: ribosome biogenesis GTP-binding protein YihA/YsxC [Mariprofundaceae bacterium]|nr:ribosome biogenesis GTP-binding protein YihA/YsxC [Mariprofundaceae bacterium]
MSTPVVSAAILWPNTRFVQSVSDVRQFPEMDLPQIAVAGHSNVGKSSLLNALFGRKGLVKTSKNPGCTRLLNLFEVDDCMLLVDLPGYGYARAPKAEKHRWRILIESYLQQAPQLKLVLVLLDIRHGPKDNDLQLIEWLNNGGIRWLPVATKADKLSGNARAKRLKEMTDAMGGMLSPLPTSSFDNRGIDDLRQTIADELSAAPLGSFDLD